MFSLRSSSYSTEALGDGREPFRIRHSSSTVQSSKAAFIPCPRNGTTAWQASPTSTTRSPMLHGRHRTVTSDPVGLARKSRPASGISGTASGN